MKKIVSVFCIFTFIFSTVCAKPKYISPNNDGVQDELEIPLQISDKRYVQGWSLVIMNEQKEVVRVIENKVSMPEKIGFKSFFKQIVTPKQGVPIPEKIIWNGAMTNGETAPDGKYFYYVTATDDNGNEGKTKEYEVVVDTLAPQVELAQISDKIFGEGAKSSLKIRQDGSVEDKWTGTIKNVEGEVVKTIYWENDKPSDFNWNGTNQENNQVLDGVYNYSITATDKAGNTSLPASITNIIYSAEKPSTNIFIEGSKYFSPNTESSINSVTFDLIIPLPEEKTGNKLVEWNVFIQDSSSKTVRTFNSAKDGEIPPTKIVFDGLDDNSNLLPDGEYQAFVTAKYLNGFEPAKISSPKIILDTEAPSVQILASDKVFGAGAKDTVEFSVVIKPSKGSPVPNWIGQIKSVDDGKIVKSFDLGEYPSNKIVWNGINDEEKIAEKGKYELVLFATDLAGNVGGGKSSDYVVFDTTESQLLLAMNEKAFSPNADKVKDKIDFTPVTQTTELDSYKFTINDSNGTKIYSKEGKNKLPSSFSWDGKGLDGVICEDGSYSAQLSIIALNGSTAAAATQPFELDTKYPSLQAQIPWSYFSPDGDKNQDILPVSITSCSNENLWTAEIQNDKKQIVSKYSWSGTTTGFEWDGTNESGNISKDGKYAVLISCTDDAGNKFSTELQNIKLDNRETKLYLTADYEGISPNDDGVLDVQVFEIKTSVKEDLLSWKFDVRKEDGTSVFSLTEKDRENLPSQIKWNGASAEGVALEGTFTGTLEIAYKKGNRVSAVSSPFICTAIAPNISVKTAPKYFSPDNDGVADDLFIQLACSSMGEIKDWSFEIKDPKNKTFWKTSGKNQITERIIWDGLSNVQKDSRGKAERVQSATDYPYEFTVRDNLGMTSVVKGIIPVDVLVIREGNVLKMAVPSIIFLADEAEFQAVSEKLSQEQVNKNIQILNRIAEILKKFPDYSVTIQGHANRLSDNIDEETIDNPREWGRALGPLSKERADAIKVYLVKKGVSASSLNTEGMGGTRPVVNPKDSDNNWKNRRVEFILQK